MFSATKKIMYSMAFIGSVSVSASSYALLNFTDTGNTAANIGLKKAADIWQSLFTDDVTINISSSFSSLGEDIIDQAESAFFTTNYSAMKTALSSDAKTKADLSKDDSYSKLVNGTSKSSSIHGNNNYTQTGVTNIEITRANAKAMGLLDANDLGIGAEITFNSDFNFDFDYSNGVSANGIGFLDEALHEIGHSVGFGSGARIYNAWATGTFPGDGKQAINWKDNQDHGVMDPTGDFGEIVDISNPDLLGFDAIGWELKHEAVPLPEPSNYFLLGAGLIGLWYSRRRKVNN